GGPVALPGFAGRPPPPPPPTQTEVATPTATVARPTPPPPPGAGATPSPATVASLAEDSSDVAASFQSSLLDVIDEAAAMADASGTDHKQAQIANLTDFRSIRGITAALKSVAAQ